MKYYIKSKKLELKLQTENNFLKYIAFTSLKFYPLDEQLPKNKKEYEEI